MNRARIKAAVLQWLPIIAPAYWCVRCLTLWMFPSAFGGYEALRGLQLMLFVECLVTVMGLPTLGGFVAARAATVSDSSRWRLGLSFFVSLSLLVLVFARNPLGVEYMLVIAGHTISILWATRDESLELTVTRLATPPALLLFFVLLTTLFAVPHLGTDVAYLSDGWRPAITGGEWSRPHRPLCFGVLYFASITCMELLLLRMGMRNRSYRPACHHQRSRRQSQ